MNVYKYINALKWKKDMLKTKVWYSKVFGTIGNNSCICKPLRLNNPQNIYCGEHVRIREGARVETIETYENQKFNPKLIIGNDSGFEQGLHLICAGELMIGSNVVVSAYVMISDNNHNYIDPKENVLDQELIVSEVKIGDYSFIGLGARIMPGVTLGKHCIVATNAVVTSGNYPDYSLLIGTPAKVIKRYDEISQKWIKVMEEKNKC